LEEDCPAATQFLDDTMTIGIGLITTEPYDDNVIGSILSRCGLPVWRAGSAEAYCRDARRAASLCNIIDMPGQSGLETLEALRALGSRTPAILIADAARAFPQDRLMRACPLDVLQRPAATSDILGWIECICAARMVLEKRRAA
jgi:FixJ family two-component response regulator